ncbi:MAG TPA: DUF262 domain-containing protein [Solirubrobacteraceae bacterium]|jgi:hypothetical protein
MRYRPRVFSVNDLYAWHQKEELRLNPFFQRRPVWSAQARSYLIDTLLEGFPIPAIQIRQIIDVNKQATVREVVDGQQRLRAIFDFLEGKLRILESQSAEFGGMRYDDLDDDQKDALLDYEVPVAMLSGASDADVLSVFARLNTYTIVLNAQEKLNAKFFGRFKQTVYGLGAEHVEFWRRNRIFTPRAITRMAEAQLASELTVAMIRGLTDGRKAIEPTYEEFDEEFPDGPRIVKTFRGTIDLLDGIFGDSLKDTEFRRTPLFYSLFLVFYDAQYGLPGSTHDRRSITRRDRSALEDALLTLDEQLTLEEPRAAYLRFREASARQTDNLRPRQTRHEVIWREFDRHLN